MAWPNTLKVGGAVAMMWQLTERSHRDRLGRAGVPLWLVISGEEVVERGFGASQWHTPVLPRVKSLLR